MKILVCTIKPSVTLKGLFTLGVNVNACVKFCIESMVTQMQMHICIYIRVDVDIDANADIICEQGLRL